MKKISKFTFIFLFLSTCFIVFCAAKIDIPQPTEKGWINDYANVLDEETEDYIFSCSKTLQQKTTADFVVVTIETLGGADIFDYATSIMREWGIGSKEKKNGLLILVATNEREIRVAVGTGLEGKITDAKSKKYLENYAIPYLKENKWNEGIRTLYSALLSEIYSEYNMEIPNEVDEVEKIQEIDSTTKAILIGIIFLIFGPVAGILFWLRRRRWGGNSGFGTGFFSGGFFGGNSFDGFGGNSGGGFGGFGGGGYSGGGAGGKF